MKMPRLGLVLLLSSLLQLTGLAQSQDSQNWATTQVSNWQEKLQLGPEKVTQLHFYFHYIVSGKNASAVRVAQASNTDTSSSLFGLVMMADDPLTEGPEPTSKLVGRAQGLYGSACQQELDLILAMTFSFVDKEYDGSSLSILGRNPAMHPVREMPIVGGTGVFMLARGWPWPRHIPSISVVMLLWSIM